MTPPKAPTTDPRVDAYIAKQPDFARPILEKIRASFHSGCPDLVETIKWGVPAFERQGLLGGMAAFKAHVGFGFWRSSEMEDPEGLFGGETKASFMGVRVDSARDLPTKKVLVSYVRRAAELDAASPSKKKTAARRKATAKKKTAAPRAPKDLVDAISRSPEAEAFWGTLAPSYRRDYVEWVLEAKRDATRQKRIVQSVEWLGEGKRRNWKYERR